MLFSFDRLAESVNTRNSCILVADRVKYYFFSFFLFSITVCWIGNFLANILSPFAKFKDKWTMDDYRNIEILDSFLGRFLCDSSSLKLKFSRADVVASGGQSRNFVKICRSLEDSFSRTIIGNGTLHKFAELIFRGINSCAMIIVSGPLKF